MAVDPASLEPLDLGWVVGLFEGEGSIVSQFPKHRNAEVITVSLSSTDADVIYRLHGLLGGYLNGPYTRGLHKPVWRWGLGRIPDVLPFLLAIEPHLCERRQKKARQAIESLRSPVRGKRGRTRREFCARGHQAYREYGAGVPRKRRCVDCANLRWRERHREEVV